MRVLHSSDLHGDVSKLLGCGMAFDLWLDTGDFFPNLAAADAADVDASLEHRHQARWMREFPDLAGRLVRWLAGRHALIMPGNHDYLDLAASLGNAGASVDLVSVDGVECMGLQWAGFREVKWMEGRWKGECRDFSPLIARTFEDEPDILVTHAPPAEVLESDLGFGIAELTSALRQSERVTTHFFGHDHRCGGEYADALGIRFYNGAKRVMLREVDV